MWTLLLGKDEEKKACDWREIQSELRIFLKMENTGIYYRLKKMKE